jgi:ubiquinone/menaquinone biosynthesis C-methylase UbiE
MTSAPMAVLARAGQFGPDAYDDWRSADIGTITERLERRLVLRLAGEVDGQRVLDIGCGDGGLSLALWQKGAALAVGCDVDARMIARAFSEAERHRARIDYLLADAGSLPFPDASFDLITIITVLAFIAEPVTAMREIGRVLSPGGRLIIGDLGKWSLWAASRRLRGWLSTAPMWRSARFRSARELRALARGAGLRVERICGAVYYPRSTPAARVMAPLDPWLGERTTFGAAFLALRAVKEANQTGQR